jgi:hypothetical protein
MKNEKWKIFSFFDGKRDYADRQECLSYSKKSPQQIENQTKRQRDEQHRNYWNVNLRSLAFVVNITRQLAKPVKPA